MSSLIFFAAQSFDALAFFVDDGVILAILSGFSFYGILHGLFCEVAAAAAMASFSLDIFLSLISLSSFRFLFSSLTIFSLSLRRFISSVSSWFKTES